MPTLNRVTCSVDIGSTNKSLKEHLARYSDGAVEAYIVVPDLSLAFNIHVVARGDIAPGLAAFVYIDGRYQCNRNRRGSPTGKDHIELRLRSKEDESLNGHFIARDWTFAKLSPASIQSTNDLDFVDNVGTIEVVILRCKYPSPPPTRNSRKAEQGSVSKRNEKVPAKVPVEAPVKAPEKTASVGVGGFEDLFGAMGLDGVLENAGSAIATPSEIVVQTLVPHRYERFPGETPFANDELKIEPPYDEVIGCCPAGQKSLLLSACGLDGHADASKTWEQVGQGTAVVGGAWDSTPKKHYGSLATSAKGQTDNSWLGKNSHKSKVNSEWGGQGEVNAGWPDTEKARSDAKSKWSDHRERVAESSKQSTAKAFASNDWNNTKAASKNGWDNASNSKPGVKNGWKGNDIGGNSWDDEPTQHKAKDKSKETTRRQSSNGPNMSKNDNWNTSENAAKHKNSRKLAEGPQIKKSSKTEGLESRMNPSLLSEPRRIIKRYWATALPSKAANEGIGLHRNIPREAYIYAAEPPPTMPVNSKRRVSYGVNIGKGADYAHFAESPEYLDTFKDPYAVFTFKYRSKAELDKILGYKVDDELKDLQHQETKLELLNMCKGDLVDRLMELSRKIEPTSTSTSVRDGAYQTCSKGPATHDIKYLDLANQKRSRYDGSQARDDGRNEGKARGGWNDTNNDKEKGPQESQQGGGWDHQNGTSGWGNGEEKPQPASSVKRGSDHGRETTIADEHQDDRNRNTSSRKASARKSSSTIEHFPGDQAMLQTKSQGKNGIKGSELQKQLKKVAQDRNERASPAWKPASNGSKSNKGSVTW